ncbi:MAG: isochorismate synthase, partial [FCB group bacterium]|nr:isochorismate synthase [FCB group bacterium]
FVIEGVAQTISELGLDDPVIGETAVLKLDQVQHLWTPVTATLQPSITDHNIIDRLHPTPAVGGTPRNEALKLIRELENFERGYYAAPIGYISSARAEFAVGIRALVVAGRKVSVFTGAGIVQGSDPEDEWCELNSKDILKSYSTESRPR